MKKQLRITYYVFWAVFALIFVVSWFSFRLEIRRNEDKTGFEKITEYEIQEIRDTNSPVGKDINYSFIIDGVEKSYCQLVFYTIHQNVKVYLDGELVYLMRAKEKQLTGRTPGCVWNLIALHEEDNGKEMVISIIPAYDSAVKIEPEIFFGDKYSILSTAVNREVPALILGAFAILLGIVYIIANKFYYTPSAGSGLAMLGLFAIQVGVWKIADAKISRIFFENRPVFSLLPFFALMLMCFPFLMFIKEMCSTKDSIVWAIPCVMSFANICLVLFLQIFGIKDYRECLQMIHTVIIFCGLFCMIMVTYEVNKVGWNKKLKRAVSCISICIVGIGVDLFLYYSSGGTASSIFGMICFTIYILILGVAAAMDAKKLMDIGVKASQFEKMAYHDQLTGLYNRTAYNNFIVQEDFQLDKTAVIVMDINNLKYVNDNMGHDRGDIYIKECAKFIEELFGDIGMCYRMGGDEFWVLVHGKSYSAIDERIASLQKKVSSSKAVSKEFTMQIACGYKIYDKLLDYDIGDTARRADKEMYREKFSMKEHQALA